MSEIPTVAVSRETAESVADDRKRGWRTTLRLVLRERTALVGSALLTVIVAAAIFAPLLSPYDPFVMTQPLAPPSSAHLLGTDQLGRDVFSFILWGARVSLTFALGAAALSILVGVVLGSLPAYRGGWVDDATSRFVELFLMIPRLFLIITVVAVMGNNILLVVTVVGLTIWPSNAKIMRTQVLTLKRRAYVQAAVVAGSATTAVLFRHILRNGIAPVIANTTLQMASAVITEAGLSFLGLSDPNYPSWGQLLNQAQSYLTTAPWLALAPGIALVLLLLALHMVGDGVTRILDPRIREGHR